MKLITSIITLLITLSINAQSSGILTIRFHKPCKVYTSNELKSGISNYDKNIQDKFDIKALNIDFSSGLCGIHKQCFLLILYKENAHFQVLRILQNEQYNIERNGEFTVNSCKSGYIYYSTTTNQFEFKESDDVFKHYIKTLNQSDVCNDW